MAYRRSLTTRARLFAQQRFSPSISYAHHEDDRKNPHADQKLKGFLQSRSYNRLINNKNRSLGFGGVSFRDPRWSQFLHTPLTTSGFLLARNMSTTNGEDKIKCIADKIVEVVSSEAAAVNEVAVAAADCWPPVAFFQYFIEWIHISTGFDWWICIVIATLCMRASLVPFMINQLKGTSKLPNLEAELEQIKQKMQDKSLSSTAVAELEAQMKRVCWLYVYSIDQAFRRVFISFFLAIQNMVEKVPSFQTGGISWFVDLTTADSFYILPFLTAFSCWINIEMNMQEGNRGAVWKHIARGGAILTLPLTASFPAAFPCYWLTSNSFTYVYGYIMKKPWEMKFFNIPVIVSQPPSATSESEPLIRDQSVTLSSFPIQKTSLEEDKSTTKRVSSSSLLNNHTIKRLEKQVKGKKQKKGKKR